MKTIILLFIGVLLTKTSLFSQSDRIALCDLCVDGLRTACFNKYSFNSESDFKSFLSIYFSMTEEQRLAYKNSSSTSAGIKALIDIIPIGFSGSQSTQEDKEEYKRLEKAFSQNEEVFSTDLVKIYSKVVDPAAILAYEACITTCIRAVGGEKALAYSIEGDPTDEFILVINWRPTTALTSSKVSSFEFPGLTLKNGVNILNGIDFKAFTPLTQTFKRSDPTKTAAISVAFVGLGEPIKITLDPVEKFSSSLPLGTIVASTLNYQQFTERTFDDRKSIWAPADGRTVSNSSYGKKYSSNVPDLRGQFLRGLNQFYSPGEPTTIVNGKDPGDRTNNNGYSYQTNEIQTHGHGITDPGHGHTVTGLGKENANNGGNHGGARECCYQGDALNLSAATAHTGVTINQYTGKETRPNNIAVYYYIKIN